MKRNKTIVLSLVVLLTIAAAVLLAMNNKAKSSNINGIRSTVFSAKDSTTLPDKEQQLPAEESSYSDMVKICFYRDGYVYVYDPQTKETRRVVEGEAPAISPFGNAIAFSVKNDQLARIGFPKTIKTIDLKTSSIRAFSSLTGFHNDQPRWSHDGKKLAFNLVVGKISHVGLLDVENGSVKVLNRNVVSDNLLVFDSWLNNDRSVLCHDLKNIYEFALDGRLLQAIAIETIIHPSSISTATRFSFSADKRYLLFDGYREPENDAVYVYDFDTGKLSAITPETIDASQPMWLPSGKGVMFSRFKNNAEGRPLWDVCLTALDGREVVTIIKDASHASYSTK